MLKYFPRQLASLIFITLYIRVLCKREYCEKDEKTGLCKVDEHDNEEEDGPCWFQEESPKPVPEQKLVRLEGVKVCVAMFESCKGSFWPCFRH